MVRFGRRHSVREALRGAMLAAEEYSAARAHVIRRVRAMLEAAKAA